MSAGLEVKLRKSSDEQVYQLWRRDSIEQELVFVEETKQKIVNSSGVVPIE